MRTPIKNHSKGIYEESWHLCDLRKKSSAHRAVGRSTLRKTDRFSHYSRKKQNYFVKSIWGFVTIFQVPKCTIQAFGWSEAIIGITNGGPIKKKRFQVPLYTT